MSSKGTRYPPMAFLLFCAALAMVIPIDLLLFLLGQKTTAYAVSYLGPFIIIVLTGIWVVAVPSKKRWPGVSAFDRFARLITFYRD